MIRPLSGAQRKQPSMPNVRRQYQSLFGLDGGLDYSKATTAIDNKCTPSCEEMLFRNGVAAKAKGSQYFSDTSTIPLDGTVMYITQYDKMNQTYKLVVHTTKHVYAYNSTNDMFECITNGAVLEDCEDTWTAGGTATNELSTDMRKGSKSLKITVPDGFTTGIAAYENFDAIDISTYTHIHFYIKSSTATAAADLDIRISEQQNGGTGATYEDLSIPALTADTWTEVSLEIGTPADLNAVLSVSLVVAVDKGAQVIYLDDIMAVVEKTGDEDNPITSEIINDYYVANNGIAPLEYWDMSTTTPMKGMTGGGNLAAKSIGKYGERLVLFGVTDTGTYYPQRVKWTVAGGLSTPPVATDWTNTGSGDTDLESIFGSDQIMCAAKIGNYYAIYGEHTVVLMDYTNQVSSPFAFYTRVPGIGMPAEKAIANLGNEHVFMGWDDIYVYQGGRDVERIGGKIKDELFNIVSSDNINRCFMTYIREKDEIRLFYPTTADTTPTKYFLYNLENRSWSRGTRSYTCGGFFETSSAPTIDEMGDDADTTIDEIPPSVRFDDSSLESLAPLALYGDTSGIIHRDNENTNNLVGSAITSYFETKDFSISNRYRSELTNWMELNFEGMGNSVTVYYSVDQGQHWSSGTSVTLTSEWAHYNIDFEANSELIRFKFYNASDGETFEIRGLEIGYIRGSDRGK